MASVTITCPRCGLEKEAPEERIPRHPVQVTCPRCRELFLFSREGAPPAQPAATPPSPGSAPSAAASASATAAASASAAPPGPAAATGPTAKITCPGCGFSREEPAGKVRPGTRISCPRCRRLFTFAETEAATPPAADTEPIPPAAALNTPGLAAAATPSFKGSAASPPPPGDASVPSAWPPPGNGPTPPPQPPRKRALSGLGALFSEAWEIYKRRGLTLVCLILLTMVPFALLGAAFLLIHSLYPDMQRSVPLVAGITVAGIVGICVVSFWAGTALIYAVTDETLTLREALGRSWPRLGSFIWLSLLMAFMIHGGIMLLLVPGLILMVWFLLGQFVLAEEDERGMNALLKSKAYVQGHFMDVALRLIAVTVIAVALGAVPVAGSLLSLLFTPFGVIFIFLVYRDLREIKGDLGFHPAKGEKWKWIGIAVLGYILPIIVVVGWLGANFFTTLNSMKSLLKQQAIPATSAPGAATMPVPGAVSGESGPVEAKPAVMTASEYDAVLNSAKVDFDSGTRCSVGPAAFLVRSFWDDARSPHFWLELKLAPLPNLELCGRNCVKVEIDSVINADDLNIYDSGNGLEGDFFRFLSLTRSETPEPHFMTLRDVHLKGGSKENDIQKVSGTLILKLPEKIETVTLDASSTGKEVGVAGAKVTLKEIAGKSVSFDYAGEYGRYLTTKAYDQGGKLLPDDGSSWNTEGDVTRQKNSYKGNVHSVKVMVASSMLERKYPFVVKR